MKLQFNHGDQRPSAIEISQGINLPKILTKKSLLTDNLKNLLCSNSVISEDELNYLIDAFYETYVSFNEELSNSLNFKLVEYELASDIRGNVTIIPKSNSQIHINQENIHDEIADLKLFSKQAIKRHFGEILDTSKINTGHIMNLKNEKIGYSRAYMNLTGLPYISGLQCPKYFVDGLAVAYADCPRSMRNLRAYCSRKKYTLKIDEE